LLLWLLKHGSEHSLTPASIVDAPRQGLTSVPRNAAIPEAFYRAAGFHVCGPRAVRIDMLERLADIIRPLTAWRPTETATEPPPGAAGGGAFKIRPEMMSIMGCSGDELGLILESLGFRREKRPVKKTAAAPVPEVQAPETPAANDNRPANHNIAPASELPAHGTEEQPAETVTAAGLSDGLPAEARDETPLASQPDAGEEQAIAAEAVSSPGEPEETPVMAEAAPVQEIAEAVSAEPEFEEVWRFRRPKPKFERAEGDGGRRRHQRRPAGEREHQRDHRPHQDRQRPQPQAGSDAGQAGPHHRRDGQARGGSQEQQPGAGQHHGRNRHHRPNADRNPGQPPRHAAEQTAGAPDKPGSLEQRPASNAPQQNRGPQPHRRHDRPKDRFNDRGGGNRDGRPPRQHGKQSFAATAAPKKPSGTVDPDSPFAALSQLKERMEKQMQTQDEVI
jgi:ATP-dependent RNA helicase SUPV3L1/SUV3